MAYRKQHVPTGKYYERKDKKGNTVRVQIMRELTVDTNKYSPLVEDEKHRRKAQNASI